MIRVHLSDESSKTVMVDERQTVREVCLALHLQSERVKSNVAEKIKNQ